MTSTHYIDFCLQSKESKRSAKDSGRKVGANRRGGASELGRLGDGSAATGKGDSAEARRSSTRRDGVRREGSLGWDCWRSSAWDKVDWL